MSLRRRALVRETNVRGLGHPEPMQESGQWSDDGDRRSLLRPLSAALGQAKPPAPEVGVGPEPPQDIVRRRDGQSSQESIPSLRDPQLWAVLARVALS